MITCMSFTSNETGGEYQHILTSGELPEHAHWIGRSDQSNLPAGKNNWGLVEDGGFGGKVALTVSASGLCVDDSTGSTGLNKPHNNLQPYVTTFFWKRII